ncbi:MAG: DUF5686 and carboxypeptidase regulatory-like domain-containing protein [Bacteroidota bacterium]
MNCKPFPAVIFFSCFIFLLIQSAAAQLISGVVTDQHGKSLPNSSVYIKGGTKGTTANNEGRYFLNVSPGKYTIVCAHVGFQKVENSISIDSINVQVNFILKEQLTELKEVTIKANAEDPAYAIIRNAIKKRKEHLNEVSEWQATVYMKGMVRSFAVPKKIMGVKVDPNRDVIDSNGKGILYFSESLTRYSKKMPDQFKEEVVSAKVSGRSQGFGFNSPNDMQVNLYENSISLEGLNSRGFISPIAANALYFYQYKYLGTFYEDGQEINKIQVTAKRKFEPCFTSGYINILEGSWRIHSIDLFLSRESQLELVDSLRIVQQMFPVKHVWMPQQTTFTATFKILGFKAGANFNAVYSDFELNNLPPGLFKGNVVKIIDTSANKKTVVYWDSIRPAPLTAEERLDYLKKDTLEKKLKDPHYLDSLDKRSNRLTLMKVLVTGNTNYNRYKKTSVEYPSILKTIQYNTVEGWLIDFSPTIRHWGDTGSFVLEPHLRYGFSNKRFNAAATMYKSFGKNYKKRWRITASGGKYIFQVNPANPIDPIVNTIATLLYRKNYMKIYEKAYGQIGARHNFSNGLRINLGASYEDRFPLENTDTSYSWGKQKNRGFTSNYPEELQPGNFLRHQAFLTTVRLTWQPGQQFIQYPTRLISLGSEKPVFTAQFTKAWRGFAGADADFGKWSLGVRDDFNMKLGGIVNYNFTTGGFIKNDNVQLPDWQHFNGNLTIIAREYTNTFQLAPYYANSTKDNFFATANAEWHLNGLLTNKIPLVRRWNLGLVTGSNAFYVDEKRNYFEFFVGIENIFKVTRIDYVWGYDGFSKKPKNGIVIGISGVLTGQGVD